LGFDRNTLADIAVQRDFKATGLSAGSQPKLLSGEPPLSPLCINCFFSAQPEPARGAAAYQSTWEA
jgi:hypothetical protein